MDTSLPPELDLTKKASETPPQDQGEKQLEATRTIAARLEHGETMVHNFTGEQREIYKKVAIACGSGTIKSEQSIGEEIDLLNYFAHKVEMIDQKTGEAFDQIRVVLFDKNGKAYSFASTGIADSVNLLISVFGNGPWTEPMPHRVVESRTNSGRKMLSLSPV